MSARGGPGAACVGQRSHLDAWAQGPLGADTDENARSILAERGAPHLEVQALLARDEQVRHVLTHSEAVMLGEAFPLVCLEESARGRSVIKRAPVERDLDPDEVALLRAGWVGTLKEFLDVAGELTSDPA